MERGGNKGMGERMERRREGLREEREIKTEQYGSNLRCHCNLTKYY